jgi:uncharacterized protein (TIGR00730 family)
MNICVFCSSSNAIADEYFMEAKKLGKKIAKAGHSLINGGANVGLMEATSISAKQNGAKTIGIIPQRMIDRSLASLNLDEVIITTDMMTRKDRMRQISDAYIALPGGFGTLEEILEVITLKQLSYHNKPIVFVNTLGFYTHLFQQFEHSYSENFSKELYREIYFMASTAEEAMDYIEKYTPVEVDLKWHKVPGK